MIAEKQDQWILELIDEYAGEHLSDGKIARIERVFQDQDPAVMLSAVYAYMRSGGRFFPRVAELWPFVESAGDRYRAAVDAGADRSAELFAAKIRRHKAIEAAYDGNPDAAEFQDLEQFYRQMGHELTADWLQQKYERITGNGSGSRGSLYAAAD